MLRPRGCGTDFMQRRSLHTLQRYTQPCCRHIYEGQRLSFNRADLNFSSTFTHEAEDRWEEEFATGYQYDDNNNYREIALEVSK